jgi:hypothetical protein
MVASSYEISADKVNNEYATQQNVAKLLTKVLSEMCCETGKEGPSLVCD